MRPEITEQEKKVDYSDLFFKPLPEVDPKLVEALGDGPCDPSKITQLKDRNDILKPGYLEIEKIKLKLPIYHGVSEEALEAGVGHLEGTSLPVGGETTHAILFGHRGLPSAKLFTDLDQLEEGDHFLIHVLNETLCYEVDKISVVKPEETSSLAVEEGKDLVTLLTCTPYGVNTERLLVRGHRVPYVEQEVADEKTPLSGISLHTNYLLWVIIGLVITTIFILVLYLKEKKLQKKKNETS